MASEIQKDKPYIIWTLRRTGGTTLAATLANASTFQGVQHEPFNVDRLFGEITKRWIDSGDTEMLEREVSTAFASFPVIKHCYELVPMQVNCAILREATRLGYHHILLKRKSEINRIFSLEIASITGAWGPKSAEAAYLDFRTANAGLVKIDTRKSLQHMAECFLRTKWISAELNRKGISKSIAFFEDLYEADDSNPEGVNNLLSELGHSSGRILGLQAFILQQLVSGSQNTKQVADIVENDLEWRTKMRKSWRSLNATPTCT